MKTNFVRHDLMYSKCNLEPIIKRIEEAGFVIKQKSEIHLSQAQAEQLYADRKKKPHYSDLIHEMTR
jgi:nucleoside diphosphate kinase